jgi:pimeloyl-ACP methyl ester carboxylesterase
VKTPGWGVLAGTLGAAATGVVVGVAARQHAKIAADRRRLATQLSETSEAPRGEPCSVVADDGVRLSCEEIEADGKPALTVVLVHGFALDRRTWHFQRPFLADLADPRVRVVIYDQRSHGRSERAPRESCTIEQLGHDLDAVIRALAPEGPLVLVGHSMGGMTIMALAEEHPELFGDRIVGVGLISTTAGGLEPHRVIAPRVPSTVGGALAERLITVLARGHRGVDGVRRLGHSVAMVATDELAFGDDVPASYVEFVDEMLSATPFEVVAEFFSNFARLDKFQTVKALGVVPTSVICGTADRITAVGHSRKLHAYIPGSSLLECAGAGHLVIMERHHEVNDELDQLLALAGELADRR